MYLFGQELIVFTCSNLKNALSLARAKLRRPLNSDMANQMSNEEIARIICTMHQALSSAAAFGS